MAVHVLDLLLEVGVVRKCSGEKVTTELRIQKAVYSVSTLFSRLIAATIKLDPTLRSAKWGWGVECIEFDTFFLMENAHAAMAAYYKSQTHFKRAICICKAIQASVIFKVCRK